MKSIPVTLLTGFLGSGKTSFLIEFLKTAQMKNTAVIINEYGKQGLDHLLVRPVNQQVFDLPNGCLCCSSRAELAEKMLELVKQKTRHDQLFDHLAIETSGVSDPMNLVSSLWGDQEIRQHYHLSKIICVISATQWQSNQSAYGEMEKQLVIADVIIISKSDLLPEYSRRQNIPHLIARLELQNPDAQYYVTPLDKTHLTEIAANQGLIERKKTLTPHTSHKIDNYHTITLSSDLQFSQGDIEQFMDRLLDRFSPQILRVKGFVWATEHPDRPLLVQSAHTTLSPFTRMEKWEQDPQTILTIIFTGNIASAITEYFQGFTGIALPDLPDRQAIIENPLTIPGQGEFKP